MRAPGCGASSNQLRKSLYATRPPSRPMRHQDQGVYLNTHLFLDPSHTSRHIFQALSAGICYRTVYSSTTKNKCRAISPEDKDLDPPDSPTTDLNKYTGSLMLTCTNVSTLCLENTTVHLLHVHHVLFLLGN